MVEGEPFKLHKGELEHLVTVLNHYHHAKSAFFDWQPGEHLRVRDLLSRSPVNHLVVLHAQKPKSPTILDALHKDGRPLIILKVVNSQETGSVLT
jgi:hypothetical protein